MNVYIDNPFNVDVLSEEPQKAGNSWAFCTVDREHLTITSPFFKCKEYGSDMLVNKTTGFPINVYGFATEEVECDLNYLVCYYKNHPQNIKRNLETINALLKRNNLPKLKFKKIQVDLYVDYNTNEAKDAFIYLLKVPKWYLNNTINYCILFSCLRLVAYDVYTDAIMSDDNAASVLELLENKYFPDLMVRGGKKILDAKPEYAISLECGGRYQGTNIEDMLVNDRKYSTHEDTGIDSIKTALNKNIITRYDQMKRAKYKDDFNYSLWLKFLDLAFKIRAEEIKEVA